MSTNKINACLIIELTLDILVKGAWLDPPIKSFFSNIHKSGGILRYSCTISIEYSFYLLKKY